MFPLSNFEKKNRNTINFVRFRQRIRYYGNKKSSKEGIEIEIEINYDQEDEIKQGNHTTVFLKRNEQTVFRVDVLIIYPIIFSLHFWNRTDFER